MKTALVSALVACANERQRRIARRFLQGLSSDELEYLAGFVGGCILDPALADGAAIPERFGVHRSPGVYLDDREHKIIIAREYLSRCGVTADSQTSACRVSVRSTASGSGVA